MSAYGNLKAIILTLVIVTAAACDCPAADSPLGSSRPVLTNGFDPGFPSGTLPAGKPLSPDRAQARGPARSRPAAPSNLRMIQPAFRGTPADGPSPIQTVRPA